MIFTYNLELLYDGSVSKVYMKGLSCWDPAHLSFAWFCVLHEKVQTILSQEMEKHSKALKIECYIIATSGLCDSLKKCPLPIITYCIIIVTEGEKQVGVL